MNFGCCYHMMGEHHLNISQAAKDLNFNFKITTMPLANAPHGVNP